MATATPKSHLTVGTTGDYPPFSLATAGGFSGFDIDLVRAIAARMAAEVVLKPIAWKTFAQALESHDLDLIASGVTVTAARRRIGGFSRPYLNNVTVLVGPAAAPGRVVVPLDGTVEALLHGRRLGVNKGGYIESVARARFPGVELVTTTANQELAQALLAGAYDFFLSDRLEAHKFMATYPVTVVAELEVQKHALYFPPAKAPLLQRVDHELSALLADGTVTALATAHGIPATLVAKSTARRAGR